MLSEFLTKDHVFNDKLVDIFKQTVVAPSSTNHVLSNSKNIKHDRIETDASKKDQAHEANVKKPNKQKPFSKDNVEGDVSAPSASSSSSSFMIISKDGEEREQKQTKEMKEKLVVDTAGNQTETKKEKKKESMERLSRTCFIGNVPIQVSKKDALSQFKQLFMPCGPIESIRFRSIPLSKPIQRKIAFIKKEFNTHRDTFNAYIVFKNHDSVQEALKLNGTLFLNKHLRVDRCGGYSRQADKSNSSSSNIKDAQSFKEERGKYKRCVFVGNLDYFIEDESLYTHFQDCGDIEYVRIIRDKGTNMGKGFGYVCFKERAAIELALALNDQPLNNRSLRVSRCSRKDSDLEKRAKKTGYEARKKESIKLKLKNMKKKAQKPNKSTKKPKKNLIKK